MSNLSQNLISPEKCAALANEYYKSTYADINRNRPDDKPDSKEYIFQLSVVKEYIQFIESEMQRKGIRNMGIKVSMGKYPENASDPQLDPRLKGYQTVFFQAADLDSKEQITAQDHNTKGSPATEIPGMNYGNLRPPY